MLLILLYHKGKPHTIFRRAGLYTIMSIIVHHPKLTSDKTESPTRWTCHVDQVYIEK